MLSQQTLDMLKSPMIRLSKKQRIFELEFQVLWLRTEVQRLRKLLRDKEETRSAQGSALAMGGEPHERT